jgi:hypothetical protein
MTLLAALASNSSRRQRPLEMGSRPKVVQSFGPHGGQAMSAAEGGRSMPSETTIEIVLTEESHECLMAHVSESSSAFNPLQTAIHLPGHGTTPGHAVVKCDLASAKTLLEVAENSCKAAVHDIKIAIKETDA